MSALVEVALASSDEKAGVITPARRQHIHGGLRRRQPSLPREAEQISWRTRSYSHIHGCLSSPTLSREPAGDKLQHGTCIGGRSKQAVYTR